MQGPKTVRREDVTAMQVGPLTVFFDHDGEELARLDATDGAVWEACNDGSSAQRIAAALALKVEDVWAALDRLADHGLFVERASPPGSVPSVSRRRLLTGVGVGMGAAAVAAPALAAGLAGEVEGKAADRGPRTQEQHRKVAAARPQEQSRKQGVTLAESGPRTQEQSRKQGVTLAESGPRTQEQSRKQRVTLAESGPRTQEQSRKQGVTLAEVAPRSQEQARKRG